MDHVKRNDGEKGSRPWHRLHLSTWLLLMLPAAALGLANLPGERVDIIASRHSFNESTCEHGWPRVWLVRDPVWFNSASVWALTDDVCRVDWLALAADLLTALTLLVAIAAAIEWRRRRRHRIWQFSLGDMILAMLVVAGAMSWCVRRHQALARFASTSNVSSNVLGGYGSISWQFSLPIWISDFVPDDERVLSSLWRLGLIRFDDCEIDLPDNAAALASLQLLLACGRDDVCLTVAKDSTDSLGVRSLSDLRHLRLDQLNNEIVESLNALTELRTLELADTCPRLTRAGAARLGRLTQLRSLVASKRCLGDAGVAAIAGLPKLEAVAISGASDADLAQLSKLKRLRYLAFPDTTATDAGLAPLAALKSLEILELHGSRITGTGAAALAELPRLRKLDLTSCGLSDAGLAGLAGLDSLTDLSLRYTPVTGAGLVHLAEMQWLKWLDLWCTETDDKGLKNLPRLPNLLQIELGDTHVTASGLANLNRLKRLEQIGLIGTRVEHLRGIDLDRLPHLKSLVVLGAWIAQGETQRLFADRPELNFGFACGTTNLHFQFEDELATLRECSDPNERPIQVWLDGTDFGDNHLRDLHGLIAIKAIHLLATRVTDVGLAAIAEFDRLEEVDLAKTPIGDAAVATLATLPKLKYLDLSYTDVTAEGLDRLTAIAALTDLGLDPSQITRELVSRLKNIDTLRHLTIFRSRAPWGQQYRGASDFAELLTQLRHDLPGIEVSERIDPVVVRCIGY